MNSAPPTSSGTITAILFALAMVLFLCSALSSLAADAKDTSNAGSKLFTPIASVLQSPRCINCHPAGDFPRQTDKHIRHLQHVLRGPDDTGVATLHCSTCHQDRNTAFGQVPGVAHWRLAPRSMAWEGLTAAQICQSIKDPQKNGGRRTLDAVIEHMKTDPLVLWAWNPGANRTSPPLTHEQFVEALEAWVAAGGPCPTTAAL